jgi:hypothetical protein
MHLKGNFNFVRIKMGHKCSRFSSPSRNKLNNPTDQNSSSGTNIPSTSHEISLINATRISDAVFKEEPVTDRYSKPDETNQHPSTCNSKININVIILSSPHLITEMISSFHNF